MGRARSMRSCGSVRSSSRESEGWGRPAPVPDPPLPSGPSADPVPPPPPGPSTAPPGPPPRILLRGECSKTGAAFSTPDIAGDRQAGQPRLKSIVVRPSPRADRSPSGHGNGWTEVQSRNARRASKHAHASPGRPRRRQGQRPSFNAVAGREAFLRRFKGLCFRCLSSEHRRVDCRDPIHCIECKLPGHIARDCHQDPRSRRGERPARAGLEPATGRGPVRTRLRFPTPPSPAPAMERSRHTDPSRRPRSSHQVVIETPEMEHQIFHLRRHAVLLTSTAERHAASPMSVGRAFDTTLRTPAHLLRVTSHDPEDFLVLFELPAHRDNAVRLGSINLDGVVFSIKQWHEDDHAVHQDFLLHVRVVIEKMPLHMWSVQGAAKVLGSKCIIDRLGQPHARARPHAHFRVLGVGLGCCLHPHQAHHLEGGAGRVEAMLGYSPPSREVAPPPRVKQHEMLIHVDRVEDWSPPSPRSSHSAQSGMPSSGPDDDRPFPMVWLGTWAMHVEDGQGQSRRHPAVVSAAGCGGLQLGARRDRDDHDGEQGRRSWKDTLLGRGHGGREQPPTKSTGGSSRQRSRTPISRRQGREGHRSSRGNSSSFKVTPPLPLLSGQAELAARETPAGGGAPVSSADPVSAFFDSAGRVPPPPPPPYVDSSNNMQEIDQAIADALAAPLEFSSSPTTAACQTPPSAVSTRVQVGAVTQQVMQLQLGGGDDHTRASNDLFIDTPAPVISTPPAHRTSAPPKARVCAAPTRQSARQAGVSSKVPVAQRASLLLVKKLGLLGPKEAMTAKVAEALIKRFDEPLTDDDIAVIAKLTRLDPEALRIAGGMAGPDAAAANAAD